MSAEERTQGLLAIINEPFEFPRLEKAITQDLREYGNERLEEAVIKAKERIAQAMQRAEGSRVRGDGDRVHAFRLQGDTLELFIDDLRKLKEEN